MWEDKEWTRLCNQYHPPLLETSTDYDDECGGDELKLYYELWAVTHIVKVSCSMMFKSCCCVFGSRLVHS
jgi:hypothetical protein